MKKIQQCGLKLLYFLIKFYISIKRKVNTILVRVEIDEETKQLDQQA